jgi:hypothetical protein
VVPVDARIREVDAVGEGAADRHRRLGLGRPVVAVLQSQAVPVHRGLDVALVDDVDGELGALSDPERGSWDRAVVGEHADRRVAEPLRHRRDAQVEPCAVGEFHGLGRTGLGQAFGCGREVVG